MRPAAPSEQHQLLQCTVIIPPIIVSCIFDGSLEGVDWGLWQWRNGVGKNRTNKPFVWSWCTDYCSTPYNAAHSSFLSESPAAHGALLHDAGRQPTEIGIDIWPRRVAH